MVKIMTTLIGSNTHGHLIFGTTIKNVNCIKPDKSLTFQVFNLLLYSMKSVIGFILCHVSSYSINFLLLASYLSQSSNHCQTLNPGDLKFTYPYGSIFSFPKVCPLKSIPQTFHTASCTHLCQ